MGLRKDLRKPASADERAVDVLLEDLLPGCGIRGTLRIAPTDHNPAFDRLSNGIAYRKPPEVQKATAHLRTINASRNMLGFMVGPILDADEEKLLETGAKTIPGATTLAEVVEGLRAIIDQGAAKTDACLNDPAMMEAIELWGEASDDACVPAVVLGCSGVYAADLFEDEDLSSGGLPSGGQVMRVEGGKPVLVNVSPDLMWFEDGIIMTTAAPILVYAIDGLREAVYAHARTAANFKPTAAPEVAVLAPKSGPIGADTTKSVPTPSKPPESTTSRPASKRGKKTKKS